MPGAAYSLSREEFLYTPELEGFEIATTVLGASQKGGMASGYIIDMDFFLSVAGTQLVRLESFLLSSKKP